MRETVVPRSRGGVTVTELGLGGAQFGNLYRPMTDDVASEIVRTAWESQIRYVDTAPHYGLGLSERRLGVILRESPRSTWTLSTKVGRVLEEVPVTSDRMDDEGFAVLRTHRRRWDFSRDGVRRSFEDSLTRLGVDRVDVVYLHDPEEHWLQARREALPALAELKAEGLVGAIGAGMNFSAPLTELVSAGEVDIVMCAGRHTLLEQSVTLLDAALRHQVSVVIAGVYNSGLLASPTAPEQARYDYRPAPPEIRERVDRLREVCEGHGVSVPAAAVAFPFRHPAVHSVVIGAADPMQVRDAVTRLRTPIPDELWSDLRAAELITA